MEPTLTASQSAEMMMGLGMLGLVFLICMFAMIFVVVGIMLSKM